ncbi:conjugative transfer ATPase%2C PFL_4706 family [Salmonella enterica subsp. enterica serovar Typhi]|nr:conjugative transfer ATPase%2C PFL_4706 family [Salmonella enterica subsp. enterica serovar Typhi]
MLNMAEWWLCLVMPPDEVEQIARFKTLSEEQKVILRSASKLKNCYTEGVVLSKQVEALFRVVMREYQCSELEAAIRVARRLVFVHKKRPEKTIPEPRAMAKPCDQFYQYQRSHCYVIRVVVRGGWT